MTTSTLSVSVAFNYPLSAAQMASLLNDRMKRRIAVYEACVLPSMREYMKSRAYSKHSANGDHRVVASLATHPAERLKKALDYWIAISEEGSQHPVAVRLARAFPEDDQDMRDELLVFLYRAENMLRNGDLYSAFSEVHRMNKALGGLTPGCLDMGSDEWADVSITQERGA